MGDDESRAAARRVVQRRLQLPLGFGVERAGRLVEDHDRRVFQQRAGDGEALALAARKIAAALADDRLQPAGLLRDELGRLRPFQRERDFVGARVGLADAQVLLDRAGEEKGSCNTTPILSRSERKVMSRISSPSMAMRPSLGSKTRCSSASAVDLPEPVAPTSAIVLPGRGVEGEVVEPLAPGA